MIANCTYSDADTSSGQAFPNLSENVFNIIAYYDNGRFDTRLAYNWRSKYASIGDGANGLQFLNIDELVVSGGQLDLSSSLHVTDYLKVQFEVLNLTNENFLRYTDTRQRIRDFRVGDRSIALGLQMRF